MSEEYRKIMIKQKKELKKNQKSKMNKTDESLEEKMDVVIKLLAMNMMIDLKTDKEKVNFLQKDIGLDSSRIAAVMNKTTRELSQYLYKKGE